MLVTIKLNSSGAGDELVQINNMHILGHGQLFLTQFTEQKRDAGTKLKIVRNSGC